jgi:AcrR family transcriptional regulator
MVRSGREVSPEDDDDAHDSLPWWPSSQRSRVSSRSGLTRERIIGVGVELVEKEGFEALTMRRVADRLNSGVMSLYWYVANREELVSVIVDELLRDVPTPSRELPWRQQVIVMCRAFVSILQPHRRVLADLPGGIAMGPKLLRMTDNVFGALRSAGFAGEDLFQSVEAIGSLTIGLLFHGPIDVERDDPRIKREKGLVPSRAAEVDFSALKPSSYPNLVAAGQRQPDRHDDVEFALETLLDGLELRLGRSGRITR